MFQTWIFSNQLKVAKVIPIHKSGAKDDENKYRPISCLPVISKVFEKAIVTRLTNFLEVFSQLSENQFGFRKNRSTEKATIQFTTKALKSLENRLHVMVYFLT